MNGLIPAADPLGLPVPVWILLALKVFGFFLHLVFMNLWLAGLPAALFLLRSKPAIAERLFHALPFFLAFGINAGIVPLLFLQTLYPQFFYPATILQAWFWFAVIPLLLIAYYAVYLASFGNFRVAAALTATVLIYMIGMMFSSAMSLTATPQAWPKIFLDSAQGGAVDGVHFYFTLEVLLRFLLVVGMAFGTLAVYFVVVAEWFAKKDDKIALRKLVSLYLVGALIFASAGSVYAYTVLQSVPNLWLFVAGASWLAGVLFAASYWKNPNRAKGVALIIAQFLVLLSNAVARQWVQFSELLKWYDPNKAPIRGEWGSFALFIIMLVVALVLIAWIALTALRRTRNEPA
ncbi:MAG TPA: hypothetical protein VNT76_10235 [Candidatus Binatus sp.]|nr:hypothetical protein [Candidatus Binatus sp.]